VSGGDAIGASTKWSLLRLLESSIILRLSSSERPPLGVAVAGDDDDDVDILFQYSDPLISPPLVTVDCNGGVILWSLDAPPADASPTFDVDDATRSFSACAADDGVADTGKLLPTCRLVADGGGGFVTSFVDDDEWTLMMIVGIDNCSVSICARVRLMRQNSARVRSMVCFGS
jgi:hypothetical protein